ncbi:MAG: N-formylglutamate amidohydrolase [Pseudomonadota bacterium]
MRLINSFNDTAPIVVTRPDPPQTPFVLSVPHSGTFYTKDFVASAKLSRRGLRRSEDTHVDSLFAPALAHGAAMVRAQFPRVLLDANRSADELDPAMFDGPLNLPVDDSSARVAGGLGVIAKVVGEGQAIYRGPLPPSEAHWRLTTLYHPYHDALRALLDGAVDRFGYAVLIDCHSMPSNAVRNTAERSSARPSIVLGDRFGTSCAAELTSIATTSLERRGYQVARNKPYAGGFITEHYGSRANVHALQIEVTRSLYMDEATYLTDVGFDTLRQDLTGLVADLIEAFTPPQRALPIAAE